MKDLSPIDNPVHCVTSFQDLISPYFENKNAFCWTRNLEGDFSEIVNKLALQDNIIEVTKNDLLLLKLTNEGELARSIILNDLALLEAHGASPTLNLIKNYDRDDSFPFFPTDVYSFHVDRSPIPTDTFLCTYHGEPSDIIPNSQAIQKILIPEIRDELKKLHDGADDDFESFLSEFFFDLHYQAKPGATPINLGLGNLWKLATDHPESNVPPCVHRAPNEKDGQIRLLMIC